MDGNGATDDEFDDSKRGEDDLARRLLRVVGCLGEPVDVDDDAEDVEDVLLFDDDDDDVVVNWQCGTSPFSIVGMMSSELTFLWHLQHLAQCKLPCAYTIFRELTPALVSNPSMFCVYTRSNILFCSSKARSL